MAAGSTPTSGQVLGVYDTSSGRPTLVGGSAYNPATDTSRAPVSTGYYVSGKPVSQAEFQQAKIAEQARVQHIQPVQPTQPTQTSGWAKSGEGVYIYQGKAGPGDVLKPPPGYSVTTNVQGQVIALPTGKDISTGGPLPDVRMVPGKTGFTYVGMSEGAYAKYGEALKLGYLPSQGIVATKISEGKVLGMTYPYISEYTTTPGKWEVPYNLGGGVIVSGGVAQKIDIMQREYPGGYKQVGTTTGGSTFLDIFKGPTKPSEKIYENVYGEKFVSYTEPFLKQTEFLPYTKWNVFATQNKVMGAIGDFFVGVGQSASRGLFATAQKIALTSYELRETMRIKLGGKVPSGAAYEEGRFLYKPTSMDYLQMNTQLQKTGYGKFLQAHPKWTGGIAGVQYNIQTPFYKHPDIQTYALLEAFALIGPFSQGATSTATIVRAGMLSASTALTGWQAYQTYKYPSVANIVATGIMGIPTGAEWYLFGKAATLPKPAEIRIEAIGEPRGRILTETERGRYAEELKRGGKIPTDVLGILLKKPGEIVVEYTGGYKSVALTKEGIPIPKISIPETQVKAIAIGGYEGTRILGFVRTESPVSYFSAQLKTLADTKMMYDFQQRIAGTLQLYPIGREPIPSPFTFKAKLAAGLLPEDILRAKPPERIVYALAKGDYPIKIGGFGRTRNIPIVAESVSRVSIPFRWPPAEAPRIRMGEILHIYPKEFLTPKLTGLMERAFGRTRTTLMLEQGAKTFWIGTGRGIGEYTRGKPILEIPIKYVPKEFLQKHLLGIARQTEGRYTQRGYLWEKTMNKIMSGTSSGIARVYDVFGIEPRWLPFSYRAALKNIYGTQYYAKTALPEIPEITMPKEFGAGERATLRHELQHQVFALQQTMGEKLPFKVQEIIKDMWKIQKQKLIESYVGKTLTGKTILWHELPKGAQAVKLAEWEDMFKMGKKGKAPVPAGMMGPARELGWGPYLHYHYKPAQFTEELLSNIAGYFPGELFNKPTTPTTRWMARMWKEIGVTELTKLKQTQMPYYSKYPYYVKPFYPKALGTRWTAEILTQKFRLYGQLKGVELSLKFFGGRVPETILMPQISGRAATEFLQKYKIPADQIPKQIWTIVEVGLAKPAKHLGYGFITQNLWLEMTKRGKLELYSTFQTGTFGNMLDKKVSSVISGFEKSIVLPQRPGEPITTISTATARIPDIVALLGMPKELKAMGISKYFPEGIPKPVLTFGKGELTPREIIKAIGKPKPSAPFTTIEIGELMKNLEKSKPAPPLKQPATIMPPLTDIKDIASRISKEQKKGSPYENIISENAEKYGKLQPGTTINLNVRELPAELKIGERAKSELPMLNIPPEALRHIVSELYPSVPIGAESVMLEVVRKTTVEPILRGVGIERDITKMQLFKSVMFPKVMRETKIFTEVQPMEEVMTKTKIITGQGQMQQQMQQQVQIQQQKTITETITIGRVITPVPPISPITPVPSPKIPFIPPFPIMFPSLSEIGTARKRKKGKGRKYRYIPSYEALVFKLPGKQIKGPLTGLELRGIPKGFRWGIGTSRVGWKGMKW